MVSYLGMLFLIYRRHCILQYHGFVKRPSYLTNW